MGLSAALIASLILGALAFLHLAWAFGSSWPARDGRELIAIVVGTTREGGQTRRAMPGALACIGVALALFGGVGVVLAGQGFFGPTSFDGWISAAHWLLIAAFFARGAIGYFDDWLRPKTRDTPFYRLNRILYCPLCLGIASLALIAALA